MNDFFAGEKRSPAPQLYSIFQLKLPQFQPYGLALRSHGPAWLLALLSIYPQGHAVSVMRCAQTAALCVSRQRKRAVGVAIRLAWPTRPL